jgi:hypothetical protein
MPPRWRSDSGSQSQGHHYVDDNANKFQRVDVEVVVPGAQLVFAFGQGLHVEAGCHHDGSGDSQCSIPMD